jgi:hypothetical protein
LPNGIERGERNICALGHGHNCAFLNKKYMGERMAQSFPKPPFLLHILINAAYGQDGGWKELEGIGRGRRRSFTQLSPPNSLGVMCL